MRMLGIGSYRTAWFMAHRIREAMRRNGDTGPLGGDGKIVEADETYHWYPRDTPQAQAGPPKSTKTRKSGGSQKRVVVGLVERGGRVRLSMCSLHG